MVKFGVNAMVHGRIALLSSRFAHTISVDVHWQGGKSSQILPEFTACRNQIRDFCFGFYKQ